MKPEEFRKGREKVERIFGDVEEGIKAKFIPEPESKIERARQIIAGLAEEADGEIQNRSVNNMNVKMSMLQGKIEKLPAKKKTVKTRTKKK